MSNILCLYRCHPPTLFLHVYSILTYFPPPPHLTASPSCQAFCRELSTSLLLCDNNRVVTEIHFKAYLLPHFRVPGAETPCSTTALRHTCRSHYCARAAYLPFANWTLPVLQAGLAAQRSFQYPCHQISDP